VDEVARLQSAVDALHGGLFHQLAYLAVHADPGLARATLHDWVPTFALSTDGLVFALCLGLAVWLLFHALWWLLARGGQRLADRRSRGLSGRRYA